MNGVSTFVKEIVPIIIVIMVMLKSKTVFYCTLSDSERPGLHFLTFSIEIICKTGSNAIPSSEDHGNEKIRSCTIRFP